MTGWDDARNAQLYAEFTRTYPKYQETSADLVRLADIGSAKTIVDLACGTGVTTRTVLESALPNATVVAIDSSEAMLEIAKREITDPRVSFVVANAEDLADHVTAADAVVCNSAIWQTPMREVFRAGAGVLDPAGRFVFNIGRQFIMLPFTEEELSRHKPSLAMYMQAIAILENDYVPSLRRRGGGLLSQEIVDEMLADAGLKLDDFQVIGYESTAEQDAAWFKVPVFANNVLDGMPYDRQVEIIDKAFARVDRDATETIRWAYFVARKASAAP